jgi:methylmalonyl-CoA mutase N-terminal domain/subunit
MLRLFDGIPLGEVSTSMTINAPAAVLLLLYELAGAERGVGPESLRGTVQNDVLKEYAARGNYIFPPRPSMRLTVDVFRYCNERLPRFNTISISGYHIREAGSSAAQELGFTLANGIAYAEAALVAGLAVDEFAPRLSFFFNAHNDVFAEVAKFRAARRIWATLMRERFGARDERSLALRFHAQTGGSTLTAQGPLTNVVRVALQAFAATAGGCQSLHTNGYDEALALPTERSATLALRTQQVLLHESGVAAVPDPFGGSEYVEALTDELESQARALIAEIDELGGAVAAIESGWVKGRIEDQAFAQQRAVERGESVIVGVNRYPDPPDSDIELQVVTHESEQRQIDRLHAVRAGRDEARCARALEAVGAAARDDSAPLLEPLREALAARCTVGEACGALRSEWGSYDAQMSDGR